MYLRHITALAIRIHRGKQVSSQCATASLSVGALPTLDRRRAEDELTKTVYSDVSEPERQLLALVHTMLSRGLVAEGDLVNRMRAVRSRLEAA